MQNTDRLLTPAEAAAQLAVGPTTLRRLLAAGLIESVRLGRSRRIPAAALTGYIARLREEAAR